MKGTRLQKPDTGLGRAVPYLPLLWFPAVIFCQELVVRCWAFGAALDRGIGFTLLFSLALGLVCDFFCCLWGERGNRRCSVVLSALLTFWLLVQTVYFTIFKTFLTVYSLGGAGQALQFWRDILAGAGEAWLPLALLLAPPAVLYLFGRPFTPKARAGRRTLIWLAACAAAVQLTGALAVNASTAGVLSDGYLYSEVFVPDLSVARFGVLTTLRLDLRQLFFGSEPESEKPEPGPTPTVVPTVPPGPSAPPADPPAAPEPTFVVYGENTMDIDFAALAGAETDETLKKLHAYFARVQPTDQNAYTGRFAGKNLILMTAEGFSRFAVDEALTPTLYRLANTGFVFENFYNPLWWVSTLDGEYVANTSLIPKPGVWSMYKSGSNSMYFCLGNQFRRLGYATNAYHNHTWDYYSRDISHPNMGYVYKGLGHGLDVRATWPESDLEMMELTVPEYVGEAPFHTYYMTVSGHMNYTFAGNAMAYKHRDAVASLPMSEGPRAYLACQMELDLALESLLRQLEAAGELENTVICLSADHYPYGMEKFQLDELAGEDLDMRFDVYRSTWILWSGDMEEPVTVEKPCSSLDILPTLSNLFGLEYDSRLLMGRDVFSQSPALVVLSDRSFITDLGRYDSKADVFTPAEGAAVPEGYASEVLRRVNDMFFYSKLILENDYYAKIGLAVEH